MNTVIEINTDLPSEGKLFQDARLAAKSAVEAMDIDDNSPRNEVYWLEVCRYLLSTFYNITLKINGKEFPLHIITQKNV